MESDNPDIQWALDLLRPDPSIKQNFFSKYYIQIPSVMVGIGSCCYINHIRGLPSFSRIYYHVLTAAGMLLFTNKVDKYYKKSYARRDAILRDYIIRHPDDFPPPERKKYGEVFLEWVPIR